MQKTLKCITPLEKLEQKNNLLKAFLVWLKKTFLHEKKRYPRQLEETRESPMGKLAPFERFTARACYTWRFLPSYMTLPQQVQIFLYCDDIQNYKGLPAVERKNILSTHRLSLVIVRLDRCDRPWTADYEMLSMWGGNNCAWLVTRLLAMNLLKYRFDEIDWYGLAELYVERHMRSGKKSR